MVTGSLDGPSFPGVMGASLKRGCLRENQKLGIRDVSVDSSSATSENFS